MFYRDIVSVDVPATSVILTISINGKTVQLRAPDAAMFEQWTSNWAAVVPDKMTMPPPMH